MTEQHHTSVVGTAGDRSIVFVQKDSGGWRDFFAAHCHAGIHRIVLAGSENELSAFTGQCAEFSHANVVRVPDLSQAAALPDARLPQAVLLLGTGAHWLQRQLLHLKKLRYVAVCAPMTPLYWNNRPVLVQSIPKSGTHLLFECLRAMGYGEPPSLDMPAATDVLANGRYYNLQHLRTSDLAAQFHRAPPLLGSLARSVMLFIVRDPRDVAVSLAHYLSSQTDYGLLSSWMRERTQHERLSVVLRGEFPIPFFVNRYFAFGGTIRDLVLSYSDWIRTPLPNVHFVCFEHLIGPKGNGCGDRQRQAIWELQLALHVPGSPGNFADGIFSPNALTFRQGRIGSFADEFKPEHDRLFRQLPQDFMELTGYSTDRLPRDCEAPHNPFFIGAVAFREQQPQLLESLGSFNIVYWHNQFYGMAHRLGQVDLRTATPDQQANWISRSVLIVGDSIESVRQQIRRLDQEELILVEENVCGFNILACGKRIIGASQMLGPVYRGDLDSRQSKLWASQENWFEGPTVEVVRQAITAASLAAEQRATDHAAREQKLAAIQKDRCDVLREIVDEFERQYGQSATSCLPLSQAIIDWLDAELNLARDRGARIAAQERIVDYHRNREKAFAAEIADGPGENCEILIARAARLQAEAELLQEQMNAGARPEPSDDTHGLLPASRPPV